MKSFIATGDGADRFEKIPVSIYESAGPAVKAVAEQIASLIREKQAKNERCVLGLATGQSPVNLYQELVRMHKEEGLSFKNVTTFNLDEYFPMQPDDIQSYHYFMNYHLFSHIDIDPAQVHVPEGAIPKEDVAEFCNKYEQQIEEAGGIDLQVLGIGRTGHIGFNEPGSAINSKTRMVYLNDLTIRDATKDFGSRDKVPTRAVTMGVGTILKAKKIVLLAWGEKKAPIIRDTLEGEVSDRVPATFLQHNGNAHFYIDEQAASLLTRVTKPWLVQKVEWTPRMIRKAVVYLCEQTGKPILKLVNKDYENYGLSDLLQIYKTANAVNINVFNDIQHTITGWPGGKPNADDTTRPVKNDPPQKKVLIFSPHPDDDVISMGGTFARLVEQHHDVHVAYETTGAIAVLDDYLYQLMDIVTAISSNVTGQSQEITAAFERVKKFIAERKPDDPEPPEIGKFKTLIRQAEARGADRYIGLPADHVHFLQLPFYNTGTVKKGPLTQNDVDIVVKLLRDLKPNEIFCAGDLADPHGTHAVCLHAVLKAFDVVCHDDWFKTCYCFWYRGAWMEWPVAEVDMAVPISPSELMIKRCSIYKHGSQNLNPAFPGDDPREFWQRAEDRNRHTAEVYNDLGMAEYEAIECFARYYHPIP